jgi:hypothetical protein
MGSITNQRGIDMDLKDLAMDQLGKVMGGQGAGGVLTDLAGQATKSSKTTAKKTKKSTGGMGDIGQAASDVLTSTNKVDGLKKAATTMLDKNGDGNFVDDILGDVVGGLFGKK